MICQYFAILCYYKIHHCWFQCLYFTTFPLCRHSVLNSQCALWSLEKSVIVYEDVKVVSLVRMAFCGFLLEFLLVIVVHCASMALTLHSQCVEDILEMQECPMYNLCASTSNLKYLGLHCSWRSYWTVLATFQCFCQNDKIQHLFCFCVI